MIMMVIGIRSSKNSKYLFGSSSNDLLAAAAAVVVVLEGEVVISDSGELTVVEVLLLVDISEISSHPP